MTLITQGPRQLCLFVEVMNKRSYIENFVVENKWASIEPFLKHFYMIMFFQLWHI
jgi:hypothetical protein